jgi:hypothetical protein
MRIEPDRHPRAARHRTKMREAGMRPVQIWVPDTRLPAFAEECRRQSLLAAESDRLDGGLMQFLDAALEDIES